MILLALALAAQDVTERVANWFVFTDLAKDNCAMSVTFVDGGDLAFHWRPRKRFGAIFYHSPEFKAIEVSKEYKIEVGFLKGGKLDDGWGERTAVGNALANGVKGFLISFTGEEILDDLAESTTLGFFYKEELIGTAPLEDSAKAIAAIRKCAASVLKNHPRDPFEE